MNRRYPFIITVRKVSGTFHTSRMSFTGRRVGPVAADITAQGSLDHFLSRMKYWPTEDFIIQD